MGAWSRLPVWCAVLAGLVTSGCGASQRQDFKVPASRAAGKTGLDIVNVVSWILFCLAVDIDDGGLAEMYYNASGAFASEAPALLREAGSPRQARIIEQANRLFAPNGRIPVDERRRRAMSHGVADPRFAQLDDRLAQLDDLDAVNALCIAAHRGAFFSA